MRAESLRTTAFRFKPECPALSYACTTLQFPQSWTGQLKELQALKTNRPPQYTSVPIASLNRVIRALLPDVISIGRSATRAGKTWLYAAQAIDPVRLTNLVHAWARVTFADVPDAKLHNALTMLQSSDLEWQTEQIDLAEWRPNQQGTAMPASEHAYALLPDYIAAAISRDGNGMEYGPYTLNWRRASLPPGQHGAELVSWPPLKHGEYRYSVMLTFTVQTVPFQDYPVVYCDMGLRRWAGPKVSISPFEQSSVYLWTTTPLLPGQSGLSNGFQVARLRRLWDGAKATHLWGDRLVEILAELRADGMPLSAEDLVNNPQLGLDQTDAYAAAIAYNTRMFSRHGVGHGVAIRERSHLLDQIEELMSKVFELAPRPTRVGARRMVIGNPFQSVYAKKKSESDEQFALRRQQAKQEHAVQRRQLVRQAVGPNLAIEIHADDPQINQALLGAICAEFALPTADSVPAHWTIDGLTIDVTQRPLNGIAASLDLSSGKTAADKVRDATKRRSELVKGMLPTPTVPTLALTEIRPKKGYGRLDDPKLALRMGFGKSGRLVQFITSDLPADKSDDEPEEERSGLSHRARNSLLDGLRQLGVASEVAPSKHLPNPLNVAAVWLINKNRTKPGQERYLLPVIVLISSAQPTLMAIAPGLDEWVPYREALLAIANDEVNVVNHKRHLNMNFVRARLRDDILPSGPTALFCHAQNIRETWTWASNGHIECDKLFFKPNTAEKQEDWRGLRIIRIRSSQGHETPEWFAKQRQGLSAASGLFQIGPRVFASVYDKPTQFKNYSHYMSKAQSRLDSKGVEIRAEPETGTWNPAIYELTVAMLQPEDGDNAAPWAMFAHALRKSAVQYGDATALPLPLHLAKRMEEYVQSIDIGDDEVEEPEP